MHPELSPDELKRLLGLTHIEIGSKLSDGSDRQYFRLRAHEWQRTRILMVLSGNDKELLRNHRYPWVIMRKIYHDQGLRVPKLYKKLPDHGLMIIQDLGDYSLNHCLINLLENGKNSKIDSFIEEVGNILGTLSLSGQRTKKLWTKRFMNLAKITFELRFFYDHFVKTFAGLTLSHSDEQRLFNDIEALGIYLEGHMGTMSHRDFHSKNLIVYRDELFMIDFQDTLSASPLYDLVSFCFDSYLPLRLDQRLKWANTLSKKLNILAFDELFHPQLLQRQLKALGSFAYLSLVAKRANYLPFIRPGLEALKLPGFPDSRWPFLSGELLKRLEESVLKKAYEGTT